jgi:MoxR-like ATPase
MSHDFKLFHGDGQIRALPEFPPSPPWRRFDADPIDRPLRSSGGKERPKFQTDDNEVDIINASLHLRRPLLITGKPGVGKSSLIYAVAHELQLGEVLVWPINTRSTLESGLYRYDAIGRLHEENLRKARGEAPPADDDWQSLGKYIKLGPLGTAFLPSKRPRALLIDEIDKSDIDLPNDLLNIFEEGYFDIPVLSRAADGLPVVHVQAFDGDDRVAIKGGRVAVREFPFIVMTSNGERDFPQPFLRRCIRLAINMPNEKKLTDIINVHLPGTAGKQADMIREFLRLTQERDLATDQLLNAVYLATSVRMDVNVNDPQKLREALFQSLSSHGTV